MKIVASAKIGAFPMRNEKVKVVTTADFKYTTHLLRLNLSCNNLEEFSIAIFREFGEDLYLNENRDSCTERFARLHL